MKKLNLTSYRFILSFFILLNFGCQPENEIGTQTSDFAVQFEDRMFLLDTQSGKDSFVKRVVENDRIQISRSWIEEFPGKAGIQYLTRANYQEEGRPISLAIPLTELEVKTPGPNKSIGKIFAMGGCSMSCKPDPNCSGCELIVVVPCEQINCNCSAGFGGCAATIRSGGNEQ